MPDISEGEKWFRNSEACSLVGISRLTFLRWVRNGTFNDVCHRDFTGCRLFTPDVLIRLKDKIKLKDTVCLGCTLAPGDKYYSYPRSIIREDSSNNKS